MSSLTKHSPLPVSTKGQAVTRSGALIAITQAWIHETGSSVPAFAEVLADVYVATIPDALRKAPLKVPPLHGDGDDYYNARRSNLKAMQRYLSGEVPIPVDLEELWCQVMPDLYRERAIFDLCARFGVLPVRVSGTTDIRALADLMRADAAMIEAMAPIMADGEINAQDRDAAIEARPKVQQAMSSLAGLLARLETVIGASTLDVVGGKG